MRMKCSQLSLLGITNVRHEILSKKPSGRAAGRLATKVWPTTRSAERKRASIRVLLLPGSTRHRARAAAKAAGTAPEGIAACAPVPPPRAVWHFRYCYSLEN